MASKFALLGTITYDHISYESGFSWQGLGGVLYQAAALCALRNEVYLYSNLGQQLVPEAEIITNNWSNFYGHGINLVPGPGNEVHLYYPKKGERVEILKSAVPPLHPEQLLRDIKQFEMLIAVLNSGFDLRLEDWRKIVEVSACPLWLDIHSLSLAREFNRPRRYVPLRNSQDWIEGVTFIQANAKETASLLGHPEKSPSQREILNFGKKAFNLGTKAIFITLGKKGVLVVMPRGIETISVTKANQVVDTTGCGDVFAAATAAKLAEGMELVQAALFGLELASEAVSARGIEETYQKIKDFPKR